MKRRLGVDAGVVIALFSILVILRENNSHCPDPVQSVVVTSAGLITQRMADKLEKFKAEAVIVGEVVLGR